MSSNMTGKDLFAIIGDFENPTIKTKPDGDCDFVETDKSTDFEKSVKCLLLPENGQSKGSPNSG